MSTAQSTLFYGVFVKTANLCFASDGYKEVKGSLLAVDLISARRRKGILSTKATMSAIARAPEEVWQMIKRRVAAVAVLRAEQYVAYEFSDDCSAFEDEEEEWQGWKHELMRRWGLETFYEQGGMTELFSKRSKDIVTLLGDFGLALPLHDLYNNNSSDLDCLCAISLPLLSTASSAHTQPFPSTTLEAMSDYYSMHKAVKYSKQAFVVSPAFDRRIKSFLSLFRLQAMSDEMETVYQHPHIKSEPRTSQAIESTNDEKESKSGTKIAHEAICCNEPDVEAHWHMWTISY